MSNIYDLKEKNVWEKFGSIWSPKKKNYIRLGTSASLSVIIYEIQRDEEWFNRVNFMIKRGGSFSERLKKLL